MLSRTSLNKVIIISALLAIYFDHADHSLFKIFKPLTTILIILIPLVYGSRPMTRYLILSIIALVFCLFGDLFLLDHSYFIWGLTSFLLGHLLFILSFSSIGGFIKNYVILILILVFGVFYYIFLLPGLKELTIPVLVYFVVISLMCWQGINLYLWKREEAHKYIALGVVFFMVSDSMLALNKFSMAFDYAGVLILSSYWLSILLIANGVTIKR